MRPARLLLTILLLLVTIVSVTTGVNLILYPSGTALGLHPELLLNSPFSNFLFPGIISLVTVGGSGLQALVLIREGSKFTLPAALLCATVVITWTSVVTAFVKNVYWLAVAFWAIGIIMIVIALYLQKKYDAVSRKSLVKMY